MRSADVDAYIAAQPDEVARALEHCGNPSRGPQRRIVTGRLAEVDPDHHS